MKGSPVLCFAALAALTAAAPVQALDPADVVSQPGVYFNLVFGGAQPPAQRLQYGLRLDGAARAEGDALPPVIALDFTETGFRDLRVGGLPLSATTLRLSQAEGAESPGLRFWRWGLPQWGMVLGAGAIALAFTDYEDPYESDPAPAEAQSTACGDDVPQPIFGEEDCI